jgi:hypothetical protein
MQSSSLFTLGDNDKVQREQGLFSRSQHSLAQTLWFTHPPQSKTLITTCKTYSKRQKKKRINEQLIRQTLLREKGREERRTYCSQQVHQLERQCNTSFGKFVSLSCGVLLKSKIKTPHPIHFETGSSFLI